jgi:predicted FMN-binding regulatory protein PaiB
MQKIKKLKAQIFTLNQKIKLGQVKNIHTMENKIKGLQSQLKAEMKAYKEQMDIIAENNYWEQYASY